jgi:ElaA protein
MISLTWQYLPFSALSLTQLYNIMRLRQAVFVLEQNCAFIDADNYDQASFHLMGYAPNGDLAAYCRIVPPDIIYDNESSIGRVITATDYRRLNLGRELMQRAIDLTCQAFPNYVIRIGAQYYLLDFYRSFGFVETGEPYVEDDILHTEMIRDCG